ncbi:MAG: P1 family peptidase [Deltaproteobacteria bacterium]|nr:P1 family peptidase [Deltaproteobacteria bacterium]
MASNDTLTAVEGIAVGHFSDPEHLTGCTVVRFPSEGAVAGVDVRGSAPGTRETDSLNPLNIVERIHALVLTGGSAFGLDAAGGAVQCLEEEGIGLDTGGGILVPIVPAAVLYDLSAGSPSVRPGRDQGYAACKAVGTDPVLQGNVGAGTGATVGKVTGMERAMKGGLGSSARELAGGAVVGALVAVNGVGDVVDPRSGQILAGVRGDREGAYLDATRLLMERRDLTLFAGANTSLAVIALNCPFSKTQLTKIAQMAQDGLARAVRPVHTMYDGDTVFAVSVAPESGAPRLDVTVAGTAAAEALAEAVVRGVTSAESLGGFPCRTEWEA